MKHTFKLTENEKQIMKSKTQYLVLAVAFLSNSYFLYLTWIPKEGTLMISTGLFISMIIFNLLYMIILNKIKSKPVRLFPYIFYVLLQIGIFVISILVYFEPKPDELLHNDYWFFNMDLCRLGSLIMCIQMTRELYRLRKKTKNKSENEE